MNSDLFVVKSTTYARRLTWIPASPYSPRGATGGSPRQPTSRRPKKILISLREVSLGVFLEMGCNQIAANEPLLTRAWLRMRPRTT